jgi:hypothetical protein
MNGLPYYKRYPRDFIEGTIGMPFELKGAYGLVLDLIYMQGGKLPDDARYISGLLGCSIRAWNGYREKLIAAGKLEAENGFISNFRASFEVDNLKIIQEQKRQNGLRPKKNNSLTEAAAKHMLNQPEPEPEREERVVVEGARESAKSDAFFDRVLGAAGVGRNGRLPERWMPPAALLHVNRWLTDLGLTEDEAVGVIVETQRGKATPGGPAAFDRAMQRLAAAKKAPAMAPGETATPRAGAKSDRAKFDHTITELADRLRTGEITIGPDRSDPFAGR